MNQIYDEDYYLRGEQTGKSNYTDYRWLPDLTIPMAINLKRHLGIIDGDTVLDFGAARGYFVKALRLIGVQAFGYDLSEWAVNNCDPEVKPYMNTGEWFPDHYDWVIAKDCFEHIEKGELSRTIKLLLGCCASMFVIVPLAAHGEYVSPKDRADKTHVIKWSLEEWISFLQSFSVQHIVSGGYWVPGIKPEAYQLHRSCGFLMVKRF